jgi:hypothetical protein
MNELEKQEYLEVCEMYFEEVDIKLNPHLVFGAASFMLLGSTAAKAHDDKKEKKKRENELERLEKERIRIKEEKEIAEIEAEEKINFIKKQTKETKEKINEKPKRIPRRINSTKKAISKDIRTNWEIDAEGYFTHGKGRGASYIQKADRKEKATNSDIVVINKLKEEGKSQGEINKTMRNFKNK